MNIVSGHGLLLKLDFADGAPCRCKRTFLVINVDQNTNRLELLNVSSIEGKEHKLLFETNERLNNHKPPFNLPSFVKMDALYEVDYFPELEKRILHNRQPYNTQELNRIVDKFNAIKLSQKFSSASYTINQVKTANSL